MNAVEGRSNATLRALAAEVAALPEGRIEPKLVRLVGPRHAQREYFWALCLVAAGAGNATLEDIAPVVMKICEAAQQGRAVVLARVAACVAEQARNVRGVFQDGDDRADLAASFAHERNGEALNVEEFLCYCSERGESMSRNTALKLLDDLGFTRRGRGRPKKCSKNNRRSRAN